MAVITPQQFTPIHEEEIIINGTELQSFNEETYKKMSLNNNWLIDLRPIGSIIFVNVNQAGGQVPDPALWQSCDGSEIINPNSPLRSIGVDINNTPNLQDRYIRAAASETGNPQGGSQLHNLTHSHVTGGPSAIGSTMDDKGDRRYRQSHTHSIASQYSSETFFDSPAYIYLIAYIKIV